MSDPIVDPSDLGTYLDNDCINESRAALILSMAQQLCEAEVGAPLPDGSKAVVLDVASRAFVNPSNVGYQVDGPYAATFGKVGGGLWLTKQNVTTLRKLKGGGGAFTIDLLDGYETPDLPAWDLSVT